MTTPREQNQERRRQDIGARRPQPESLPSRVRIDAHEGCRAACRHCFRKVAAPNGTMSRELWSRLADELFPVIDVLELGGPGEPLHDPEFGARLQRVDPRDGPRIWLTTSGDGLAAWAEELIPRCERIVVSLESVDPQEYGLVRTGLAFDHVVAGVEALRRILLAQPQLRVQLGARVTLWDGNQERLSEIVARLSSLGVRDVWLAYGVELPGAPPELRRSRPAASWDAALQRSVLQGIASGVRVHYPQRVTLDRWSAGVPCSVGRSETIAVAPWTSASVSAGGSVAVCCPDSRLSGAVSVPLGSRSFREVWRSEPFQALRGSGTPPEVCAWCPMLLEPDHGK